MADYPKTYVKGDKTRVAHNVRDDVKFQFEGYHVVETKADESVKPTEAELAAHAAEKAEAAKAKPKPTAVAPK